MGFGADSISVVVGGLRRSTGTFAERLVSWGYIGDILNSESVAAVSKKIGFLWWVIKKAKGRHIEA